MSIYSFAEETTVISPQLIFYPEIIRENIDRMVQMAGGPERLWPHIKTHKSLDVTKMLVGAGIDRFKCATIAEMEMAAMAGGRQLVLAYPLIGPNVERFLTFMKTYPAVEAFAIADDTGAVEKLAASAAQEGVTVKLLMDIDMGQHRTGVPLEKAYDLYTAWDELEGIHMAGMHCYDGHRHEGDLTKRREKTEETDAKVLSLIGHLQETGCDVSVVIYGGTPSFPCHQAATTGFLSPGTCVIQDAGYRDSFPDLPFVPGAAVLTRVVSHPTPDTFTLDLGTKAVATDPPLPRAEIVGYEEAEWVMQNEEHLVLRLPKESLDRKPAIGTELYALPVHVCPTSALYPAAAVVEKGHLTGWWDITARNRKIHI